MNQTFCITSYTEEVQLGLKFAAKLIFISIKERMKPDVFSK